MRFAFPSHHGPVIMANYFERPEQAGEVKETRTRFRTRQSSPRQKGSTEGKSVGVWRRGSRGGCVTNYGRSSPDVGASCSRKISLATRGMSLVGLTPCLVSVRPAPLGLGGTTPAPLWKKFFFSNVFTTHELRTHNQPPFLPTVGWSVILAFQTNVEAHIRLRCCSPSMAS